MLTLDKSEVYTLVGKFDYENNLFTTVDNQTIECYAYRHHSHEIKDSELCAVNIKYIKDYINAWVIFQSLPLDNH